MMRLKSVHLVKKARTERDIKNLIFSVAVRYLLQLHKVEARKCKKEL